MRLSGWILATVMVGALALAGCSNQSGSVDTAPFEKSFAAAEGSLKESADKAVASIKAADYSGALTELKKLAENAELTPEQKQAIDDLIAQVQKAITDAAGQATEEAGKALQDVSKGLPK